MDTHIKFRQKVFGKRSEVVKFIKTPQGIITTTALGVSSANLTTNMSRHRNDKAYQEKQIDAMNSLTKSITGLDKTVKGTEKEKKTISFKPKNILQ